LNQFAWPFRFDQRLLTATHDPTLIRLINQFVLQLLSFGRFALAVSLAGDALVQLSAKPSKPSAVAAFLAAAMALSATSML
jgi:hypothetical protein